MVVVLLETRSIESEKRFRITGKLTDQKALEADR